jgi:hypothetical protein
LLLTRRQRQELLQDNCHGRPFHEQAISRSWAQRVLQTPQMEQCFHFCKEQKKEKISFFLLALSRLTCDAIGGEGQHLRSTGAGGDGSKKRGRWLPRRRHRHPQERISTSFHCSRILAEIYGGFGTTASWGITPILTEDSDFGGGRGDG